jgi:hypothetical protein
LRHELTCGVITNESRIVGNNSDIIIAKLHYKTGDIDITYDCTTDRVLIHEWYKIASEELSVVTEELRVYFNNRRK